MLDRIGFGQLEDQLSHGKTVKPIFYIRQLFIISILI